MYSEMPLKAVHTSLYVRCPQGGYSLSIVSLINAYSKTNLGGNAVTKLRQMGCMVSIIASRTMGGFSVGECMPWKVKVEGGLELGIW